MPQGAIVLAFTAREQRLGLRHGGAAIAVVAEQLPVFRRSAYCKGAPPGRIDPDEIGVQRRGHFMVTSIGAGCGLFGAGARRRRRPASP